MQRFFVVLVALVAFGRAGAQDVFTVPEVPVFAEAKTAGEAQTLARDQGRLAALDLLLRRLVAEEDWVYLPSLSKGEEAQALSDPYATGGAYNPDRSTAVAMKQPLALNPDAAAALERETNVFNEKSSGTTYRANITYRFKPDAIRDLLRTARLPYSEEQAREVMVLPVLETANGLYLWEAKNPWARAWLERPLTAELTPMVLPRGDMIDVEAISAEEARNLNAAALRAFQERYGEERLLLALGKLSEVGGNFRLYVQLIEATPPSLEGSETSAIGTTVTEAFFRGSDDDFPALARRAVEATVQRHSRQWKRQTLVDFGRERAFELTAWFGTQREWTDIQNAIQGTPLVRNNDVRAFNTENAIMALTVVGAEEQFDLAMQQRGLDVWQDTTGRWHIAQADRAGTLQATMQPLTTDIDAEADRRRGLGRFFRRGGRDRSIETEELPELEDNQSGEAQESEDGEEVPDLPDDLFGDDDSGDGN
jgi:hypothetical protein